jgi:hypothetical protein
MNFLMRISQAFPLLKCFSVKDKKQSMNYDKLTSDMLIHLISLNIIYVHTDYVLPFLLETKTHLLRLTKLIVD